MFIKICGITRLEDAMCAAELGATAIGFVLWRGSRRFIEPGAARSIAEQLPRGVVPVGVFVNEAAARVNALADEIGLGAVQLHGDEDAEYCGLMSRHVIKALPLGQSFDLRALEHVPPAATLLLDASDPAARGGTGRTVDWHLSADVARRRPSILAGGLNARNIVTALRSVAPYGVDVSSGVESAPGIKDHDLLHAFFTALRGAMQVGNRTWEPEFAARHRR